MVELTKAELELIQKLWKLKKAYLNEIVDSYEKDGPAYTTISTLLSRMCTKGYVGFEKHGRDKHYYPILKKSEYTKSQLKGVINNFFNGSKVQFANYFTQKTELSTEELKALQDLIQKEIERKSKTNG
ncbi:MAG: BlaI/MecI/CopY family transcriptional regulator [Vicingaceae bacterium]